MINTNQVTVSATAVQLNTINSATQITLTNRGSATCFIGNQSSTSTTTGFEVAAGDSVGIDIEANDGIYAVCATTTTLHILEVTR